MNDWVNYLWDSLWINVHLATMTENSPYGVVRNAALAVRGERIEWIGEMNALPSGYADRTRVIRDGEGCWISPGLVDCHTHLVYAGNRSREFALRLQGATYEEIARQGGGIRSTVAATRKADEEELFLQSAPRLLALMEEGLTTVEIKSGYGLDHDTELRMLRVARLLGERYPVTVVPTFLGAHALPPEFEGRADAYIDYIVDVMIPEIASKGLAVSVDAFCETIGFTAFQTDKVLKAAKDAGLQVKLHADQLSDQQGASLAARYGALSADHLEYVSEIGVEALAQAKSVAVLLPGAFYFIREKRLPPVDLFRKHKVPMAISTDSNPGTSPTWSLLLMMNMACTLFGLTPEEALAGVTRNGAKALGLLERIGTLEKGKDADFVLWDIDEPEELAYGMGHNPCLQVFRKGREVIKRQGRWTPKRFLKGQ